MHVCRLTVNVSASIRVPPDCRHGDCHVYTYIINNYIHKYTNTNVTASIRKYVQTHTCVHTLHYTYTHRIHKYTHTYMHTLRHTHTHTHITIMFGVVWLQNNVHQRLWHIKSVLVLEGFFNLVYCAPQRSSCNHSVSCLSQDRDAVNVLRSYIHVP